MPIYIYYCSICNQTTEVMKSISLFDTVEYCSGCGERLGQKFAPTSSTFGWRLTERAHERFMPKEEVERDV